MTVPLRAVTGAEICTAQPNTLIESLLMPSCRTFLVIVLLLMPPAAALADSKNDANGQGIGLALGSGGAGGLAHIEILRVFDELEIRPARITGTSVGAVLGALYAAGLSAQEIEDIFRDFAGSELDALSGLADSGISLRQMLTDGLNGNGLIDPAAFIEFLAGHVDARTFEALEIPLAVVATDFWSGETVVMDEGDLFKAVHASMAVPGLFEPVEQGDMLLVDGGTSNPLPFALLSGAVERVVAIDVSGTRDPAVETVGMMDLMFKTFELMQQSLIHEMRLRDEPDLYIKVDTSGIRLLEMNKLDTILEQARPAAGQLREKLIQWHE